MALLATMADVSSLLSNATVTMIVAMAVMREVVLARPTSVPAEGTNVAMVGALIPIGFAMATMIVVMVLMKLTVPVAAKLVLGSVTTTNASKLNTLAMVTMTVVMEAMNLVVARAKHLRQVLSVTLLFPVDVLVLIEK